VHADNGSHIPTSGYSIEATCTRMSGKKSKTCGDTPNISLGISRFLHLSNNNTPIFIKNNLNTNLKAKLNGNSTKSITSL
jgi:hypothetical protein